MYYSRSDVFSALLLVEMSDLTDTDVTDIVSALLKV